VATQLGNLAMILRDLGQPAAARPVQERALTITEATCGSGHPDVVTHLSNLARILRDLGQRGAAMHLEERAVSIFRGHLHRRHAMRR
jgi:hypothetical protein